MADDDWADGKEGGEDWSSEGDDGPDGWSSGENNVADDGWGDEPAEKEAPKGEDNKADEWSSADDEGEVWGDEDGASWSDGDGDAANGGADDVVIPGPDPMSATPAPHTSISTREIEDFLHREELHSKSLQEVLAPALPSVPGLPGVYKSKHLVHDEQVEDAGGIAHPVDPPTPPVSGSGAHGAPEVGVATCRFADATFLGDGRHADLSAWVAAVASTALGRPAKVSRVYAGSVCVDLAIPPPAPGQPALQGLQAVQSIISSAFKVAVEDDAGRTIAAKYGVPTVVVRLAPAESASVSASASPKRASWNANRSAKRTPGAPVLRSAQRAAKRAMQAKLAVGACACG